MTEDSRLNKLALNARGHRPDEGMERLLALRDSDYPAYLRLPTHVLGAVEVYSDLRDHHRRAVEAGAITEETPT